MKIGIINWFKNISIKNKLYLIAGVMFFLITLELFTLWTMIYLLSATRAYVGGEGLWSKAQKDGTFYLLKYSNSHEENDYQKFLSFMKVVQGDEKARLELIKPRPDLNIAYQGFLEGRNQPGDIPRLINLFRWFKNTYYLQKAGYLWTAADTQYIPKLVAVGDKLHQQILAGNFTPEEHAKFVNNLYEINSKITILADDFSYALGDASRWLENVVLRTILSIAILVEASGLLLTVLVTHYIRRGIYEIIKTSKKVQQDDFTARATRYSNDEIGQLAGSFNKMINDLEQSIISKNKEIQVRKEKESHLEVRYEITRVMVEYFTLEEAAPKIIEIMCQLMQLQYGGFWRIDNKNNVVHCSDVWAANKKAKIFAEQCKQMTFEYGSILPGKVWKIKKPFIVQNIAKESDFFRNQLAENAGLRSAFALPVLFEGEVRGIFEFFSDHFYTPDAEFLHMLSDISNMMGVFIQREQAQKRVVSLSRLTGMAEVASNVLHNVGNTLNSINTSVSLMSEKNLKSKMATIIELDKLLQQHKSDMQNFLINDPKGQSIPKFLSLLAHEWQAENKYFSDELQSLTKNIGHVKNIIILQQSLSHAIGATEEVELPQLIEEAIMLNKLLYERAAIEVVRDFEPIQKVVIEKEKLFQILMNIIKNGIDALIESAQLERRLIIRLRHKDEFYFVIEFIDNGSGIALDNINKIFSHGFTTKKTGHGFGLHTCALYAEELGGTLIVESGGVNLGANFILTLPYQPIFK